MADIQLKNVVKTYENGYQAVTDFNLDIKDQEFIVFVGPSGCGKSTTLRMIAGLEDISAGEFYIDDALMNKVASKDRDIAMVFQNYALYPHMSVFDNMAFGLKLRKFPKEEVKERVNHAAAILGLEDYLDRKPKLLSGGQRQRVALGRAIVRNPKVFLMDEPLSNLDAKLRVQMRAEIMKLHRRLEATTIYVTHDQTEAMTMASRLVVMKDGVVQQVGTPKEVYDFPNNMFVGSFIGSPGMNFIQGVITGDHFVTGNCRVQLPVKLMEVVGKNGLESKEVVLGIRPEDMIRTEQPVGACLTLPVGVSELLGAESIVYTTVEDQPLTARIAADETLLPNSKIHLQFLMDRAHLFDKETEKRYQ